MLHHGRQKTDAGNLILLKRSIYFVAVLLAIFIVMGKADVADFWIVISGRACTYFDANLWLQLKLSMAC